MAAVIHVGLDWESQPYNPAPPVGAPHQTILPQPPAVGAPVGQPAGASYTWVDPNPIVFAAVPNADLCPVAVDLARVYDLMSQDIARNDPNQDEIQTKQLINLILAKTLRFIVPVYNSITAAGVRANDQQSLLLHLMSIMSILPIPAPLDAYNTPNWVTTKSHYELMLEILILRYPDGWAALRRKHAHLFLVAMDALMKILALMFVAADDQAVIFPPLLRTGYITFETALPNPRRSTSPFVSSLTNGPAAIGAVNIDHILTGTSLPKANGYPALQTWAYNARLERYRPQIFAEIQTALLRRDQGLNVITSQRAGAAAVGLAAKQALVPAFSTAVANYKAATPEFFYHPHACVSYTANMLTRRTFCWSCWTLYRFDANETVAAPRWIEYSNYEPGVHAAGWAPPPAPVGPGPHPVAPVPGPAAAGLGPWGNCAESMLHNLCSRWGAHGMITVDNNQGQINMADGNWVPTNALPPTPAAF
ncbi:hypothetical protein MMC11_005412 [Xylographa trunciseda]|nr:hypothetical protein [Xylographa trunciseda]